MVSSNNDTPPHVDNVADVSFSTESTECGLYARKVGDDLGSAEDALNQFGIISYDSNKNTLLGHSIVLPPISVAQASVGAPATLEGPGQLNSKCITECDSTTADLGTEAAGECVSNVKAIVNPSCYVEEDTILPSTSSEGIFPKSTYEEQSQSSYSPSQTAAAVAVASDLISMFDEEHYKNATDLGQYTDFSYNALLTQALLSCSDAAAAAGLNLSCGQSSTDSLNDSAFFSSLNTTAIENLKALTSLSSMGHNMDGMMMDDG
uniref:Uncharacterized protein n=1 Tax=Anopheles melas TaxID=34690 RepID=A0A182UK47_9DIPT